MDADRFDALARSLPPSAARRWALAAALGGGLALFGLEAPTPSARGAAKDETSRKKKKPRKKKPKLNRFGCVDVGGFCRNNGQCCSNICTGKKNRKTCQAHNDGFGACGALPLGFCAPDDGGLIAATVCTSSVDEEGFCVTTTGDAFYCAVGEVQTSGCVSCTKDKDCERFCGAGAACIQCPACGEAFGVSTACASPNDSCVF